MGRVRSFPSPGARDLLLLDDEVRRIVGEAHVEVVTLLTENRPRLDALASALLEHETLDEADAYEAAGVTRPQATLVGEPPQPPAPERNRRQRVWA